MPSPFSAGSNVHAAMRSSTAAGSQGSNRHSSHVTSCKTQACKSVPVSTEAGTAGHEGCNTDAAPDAQTQTSNEGGGQCVIPQKPSVQLWGDAGPGADPWACHLLLRTWFSPLSKNMPDDVLIFDVVKCVFLSSDPESTTTLGASLGSACLMISSHSSASSSTCYTDAGSITEGGV